MLKALIELFRLLTPDQRRRFYSLQALVVLMAFLELVGIASIGPFMALVADINLIESNVIYNKLYVVSGLSSPTDFLFATGVGVLAMLGIASFVSVFTTWRLSLFSMQVGTEIADRLYQYYLRQNWLFHASGSSAQLTKQITTEASRVTHSVIVQVMHLLSRLVLAIFISAAVISYNPFIAIVGLLVFTSGYVGVYFLIRTRLIHNGTIISDTSTQRFRLMNEGFGGIKDLLLLDRTKNFIEQFHAAGKSLAHAQGTTNAYSQVPRYFMELIAFGSMIALILILLKLHDGTLSQVLPVLAVYALAGFKLLPALQQIYGSITNIKGGLPGFDSIKPDLIASQMSLSGKDQSICREAKSLPLGEIALEDITFIYPDKDEPALANLSLTIPFNSTVGFVGESGSGKSTTIDLILALIDPQQGRLKVGDAIIDHSNKDLWRRHIGFVPQSIFLGEGSIAENIAFGLGPSEIDQEKIRQAVSLAHLDELVASLPAGLDTKVGERGVQLSGGQRQRIGIARALYSQASVLVFDEATSALDGITENIIMSAIHELAGQKTIILIAHRLKTVQQCDKIYMLERGRVVDQGTFSELLGKNEKFKQMARQA
ncbi:ABC transporter ATP-binding protein [Pseudomonas sp. MDMC216]|nr:MULTISPECIES: ABC transporter ATP-binding protein [unclassified Pseudomonas]MDI5993267.1 ABC transporter ATP-binding protein [Pseudomonas sp. MDMC216]MDI6006696.1 ABC transporter ATP-binding protein [Pseudomonas sp. MDMC17]RAR32227.1 ABC transporter ATP-binding protein [Pseudomonas sp. MDMC224]